MKKIKDYEGLSGSDINQAKIVLADEATKLLHGKEDALKAKKTSINTFEKKSGGDELPTTKINKNILKKGLQLKEFIISIKFAKSNSDFKRNLENRAYRVNNKIIDSEVSLTEKDIEDDSIKISFGKKRHHLIKAN